MKKTEMQDSSFSLWEYQSDVAHLGYNYVFRNIKNPEFKSNPEPNGTYYDRNYYASKY